MKKKLLTCILVGCVFAGVLTGCNTQSTTENNNTNNEVTIESEVVAETKFGQVSGTVTGEDVITYYGVPYGKNPVGELRWSYPEDPEAWTDVLDCSEPTEIAMQMKATHGADGSSTVQLAGTTDCLNLDIYTKKDAKDLPVIVYVHGGNNQTGTSLEIPGTEIVEKEDVVYVSLNYRLGLLGYNCLPAVLDEGESGNFGLMDIKKSLEWVKENIAEFGGNPENITLSGFSAGGRDVMATLISPEFEDLYDKAVVYSGGMTIANLEDSQKKVAEIMAPLVVEDGVCQNLDEAKAWLLQDTEEVTSYLMGLKEDRIISLLSDAGIRMSKFPHLYGDDITIPSTGFENAEYVSDVPIVMLTGTDEFSVFSAFDKIYSEFGDEADSAKNFAVQYGSDFYRTFNTQLSAEKMDENYDSDMYICEIQYGDLESDSKIETIGAFHGIFVPMLTSEHGYKAFYDFENDALYQELGDIFVDYLANFATNGNPNGEGLENWKPWTLADKNTLVLTSKDGKPFVENADVYETNEEIIARMTADTTVSEEVKSKLISSVLNGRWFSSDLDKHFGNSTEW